MKKQLDQTAIVNELTKHSVFFRKTTSDANARTTDHTNGRTPDATNEGTGIRTNRPTQEQAIMRTPEPVMTGMPGQAKKRSADEAHSRTQERAITRHSFNFYRDQVESLRRLGAQAMLQGRETNLSGFVREALDDYLAKQHVDAE